MRQRRPRARKALKDGIVGMLVHGLQDFLVQARHRPVQRSEHARQRQDQVSSGHDDGRVGGKGFCFLYRRQALLRFFGAAAVVLEKKERTTSGWAVCKAAKSGHRTRKSAAIGVFIWPCSSVSAIG